MQIIKHFSYEGDFECAYAKNSSGKIVYITDGVARIDFPGDIYLALDANIILYQCSNTMYKFFGGNMIINKIDLMDMVKKGDACKL